MTGFRQCERQVNDRRCNRPAVTFVMSQWVCATHDTEGAVRCSHSLAPGGRCAYCGAVTEGATS